MRFDREVTAAAVRRLVETKRDCGGERLPDGVLASASQTLEVPVPTLSRWVSAGGMPPARRAMARFELDGDEEALAVLYEFNAHRSIAYQQLAARRAGDVPSRRTFYRAYERLPHQIRAAIQRGEVGWREHRPTDRYEPEHRNDHWQVDHQQLDVWLKPAHHGHKSYRPWLTVFEDAYSRAVMSYVVSKQPNQSHVLNGLGAAIRRRPEHGPFCGVPKWLTSDRGSDLISDSVIEALTMLQITAMPTLPGHPEHNGKVERLHQTIASGFLAALPGYTGGAKDRKGRPLNGSLAVAESAFLNQLADWIHAYNTARRHSALGNLTPLEAWNDDDGELIHPPKTLLYRYLRVADRSRTVNRSVVRFGGADREYIADFLPRHEGDKVEIRYDQNDTQTIEVFDGSGTHLGTATRRDQATPEDVDAWIQANEEIAQQHKKAASKARKHARRTAASITDRGPARDTTDVPPAAIDTARQQRRRAARDVVARNIARTNGNRDSS